MDQEGRTIKVCDHCGHATRDFAKMELVEDGIIGRARYLCFRCREVVRDAYDGRLMPFLSGTS